MAGAGGVTAVNFMGEVAKPDGLTAGYFTGSLFHQQIKEPSLRVDLGKFGFITGVQGVTVSYVRADLSPGIKKPADFVKAQKFRAAGLSISSSKDVRFRLSFDLLGLKYDYVTGYNSSSDARLAVQRGEAQYHDETLPSYRAAVEPQMVQTGVVTPLYYTDLVSFDGEIIVSSDVPELLPFTHYYRQIFGKSPSGIKYEALKAANMSSTNMTRMIMLPPSAPAEAIAALRQGITGLSKEVISSPKRKRPCAFTRASRSANKVNEPFNERRRSRRKSSISSRSISRKRTSKSQRIIRTYVGYNAHAIL